MPLPPIIRRLLFILLPVVIALGLTALCLLALQADPIQVAQTVWDGAFRDAGKLAGVLNFWIPLTLAAMGLIITFTAGLWNIGVEGQMMAGAIAASWSALYLPIPQPELRIAASVICGGLGGAGWALLVGSLKTRFGVNEIFGGVALNAIINTLAIYLISGPWQPPEGGSAQFTPPFPKEAWLPVMSPDFPVPLFTLMLTIIAAIGVILALRGTRFGLELRAAGKSPRSALLLGVPVTRAALIALALCGALAGIAGSQRVLHTYHSLRPLVSGGIGFYALLIVLLANFRALPVPFLTFVLAAIVASSTLLSVRLGLDQSLIGVFQGILVLVILMTAGLRQQRADAGKV